MLIQLAEVLQFHCPGKKLMCAEISPHIVFSKDWWVETKEQNPEELKLEFRKDM